MSINAVTIIGGGNLGKAIAEGLISSEIVKPKQITVTKRNTSALDALKKKGISVTSDNKAAVKKADVIFLCVKPFQAKDISKEISKSLNSKQIIISVISGVSIEELEHSLGKNITVFRAMPNTAISIKESMTCISYKNANAGNIKTVETIFNALGKTITIDEKLMDASTILGACGTGFAMRYIRANMQAGIEIGFDAVTASLIAAQTVKGAADLLIKNNSHPEQEIDKVTTPKGVTITGLNQMEHHGLSSSVIKGITEAYKKMNS